MALPEVSFVKPSESSMTDAPSYSLVGGVTAPRPSRAEARARTVTVSSAKLTVELTDGRTLAVPLTWFPRLIEASPRERKNFRLVGDGRLIHWPAVDEDVDVANLLRA